MDREKVRRHVLALAGLGIVNPEAVEEEVWNQTRARCLCSGDNCVNETESYAEAVLRRLERGDAVTLVRTRE